MQSKLAPAGALTIGMTSSASAINFPLTKARPRCWRISTTFSVHAQDERSAVDAANAPDRAPFGFPCSVFCAPYRGA